MDAAVGEERDRRADDIDDAHGQGAAFKTVAKSQERIGSFSRLRNEDARIVAENGGLSVEEVGCEFHGDGDLSKLFEDAADGHARVVASAAGNEDDPPAAADGVDVLAETAECDLLVLDVQAAAHGVDDGLGLLKDFLLHKMVEFALHDLLQFEFNSLDGADVGGAVVLGQTMNVELAFMDVGNVIILEIKDFFCMFDNGRRIRGEEEFGRLWDAIIGEESTGLGAVEQRFVRWCEQSGRGFLDGGILGGLLGWQSLVLGIFDVDKVDAHLLGGAHADDKGGTLASGDKLVGVVDGLEKETKGTLELLDDGLCQDGEVDVRVKVVEIFGEFGDALGVRFGLEAEAFTLQEGSEFLVVGDDAIVDDGKLPTLVRSVWMAVQP